MTKRGKVHFARWLGQFEKDGTCLNPGELTTAGTITIAISTKLDESLNRSTVRQTLSFKLGKATSVPPGKVLRLLDPDSYGMLLEECDEKGKPLYPCTIETQTSARKRAR